MESKQVTDQLTTQTNSSNLRKTLGMEIKEIQLQLGRKEQMIKEMASKLEFLNDLVVRDMKGEKDDLFTVVESEKVHKCNLFLPT